MYKLFVSQIAKPVKDRLIRDETARSSGLIINTTNLIEGVGLDILLHAIQVFEVDVVLVMNHDKLFSSLSAALNPPSSSVSSAAITTITTARPVVIKLPTSGGIVHRDVATRARQRKAKLREYFYGKPSPTALSTLSVLSPERREGLPLSSFLFLRAGGIQLTEGMRIIDRTTASHQDTCKLIKVLPSSDLLYSVVAVLHDPDGLLSSLSANLTSLPGSAGAGANAGAGKTFAEVSQQILASNIAGFVNILQLDFEHDRMTILSPCPGALPSNILLVGSIKWVE